MVVRGWFRFPNIGIIARISKRLFFVERFGFGNGDGFRIRVEIGPGGLESGEDLFVAQTGLGGGCGGPGCLVGAGMAGTQERCGGKEGKNAAFGHIHIN